MRRCLLKGKDNFERKRWVWETSLQTHNPKVVGSNPTPATRFQLQIPSKTQPEPSLVEQKGSQIPESKCSQTHKKCSQGNC